MDGEWITNDGKAIRAVWWPDTETDSGRHIAETPVQKLTLLVEHMGDRNECWVRVTRHGIETGRHNARFVSGIEWAHVEPTST